MRIGIDVRYLSHGLVGGVHSSIKSFVPELLAQAGGHEVFLYADTKRPFEIERLPANTTLRLLPYRSPLSSFALDLTLRSAMERDGVEVAHFPANYGFGPRGGRTVVTLHDEINVMPLRDIISGHRKDARTVAMMTYLHLCSTAALRGAAMLITVSEYARGEIARHSGYDRERIVPIHHGRAPDLRRVEDPAALADVRARHGVGRPFVLADALKNPAAVVRAWRRLPEDLRGGRQIVFFSRRPDPLPIVGEAVAAGEARLLVRPSREDLIALYSMAEAFVFPSWIEGFGIPLLEAMTCGAPVVASDRGSIPEVLGGAGLVAGAEDDAAIARHLGSILGDPAVAADLRQRGFRRAGDFSWAKTAAQILDCYHRAAAPGRVGQPA